MRFRTIQEIFARQGAFWELRCAIGVWASQRLWSEGAAPGAAAVLDMIEQKPMSKTPKRTPALDEARLRQQAIGVKLRQMFDEVVNEPVPDAFFDILRRADERKSEEG